VERYSYKSRRRYRAEESASPGEIWARRLNKVLIAVGVIAFSLIIADRVISIYETEDSSESSIASINAENSSEVLVVDQPGDVVSGERTLIERNTEISLQEEFGGELVFVSLSKPKYVITADERRFDVGSAINEHTQLADITETQLILDKDGERTSFSLPELVQ
jgi:hypothetical protein